MVCSSIHGSHIRCRMQTPGSDPCFRPTSCLFNFQEQLVELRKMHCLGCLCVVKSVCRREAQGRYGRRAYVASRNAILLWHSTGACPLQVYESFITETLLVR